MLNRRVFERRSILSILDTVFGIMTINHTEVMEMRITILAMLILLPLLASAQEGKSKEDIEREKKFQEAASAAGKDTATPLGWSQRIVTGANLTQVSFTDWVQGGENALSYTLWLKGKAVQELERTSWSTLYNFTFGQTRLGSQGLRKTDDEIYAEMLLIYKLGVYINPYASATLRTQFAKGYMYDDLGNKTEVSKFFDPGYVTESVGAAYKPMEEITTRIGVGAREIFSSRFTNYTDDPTTPEIEKRKIDGGLESVTNVAWKFATNMLFTSNLEMFAPFKHLDRVVVRSDNTIAAKVSENVVTSLNVQFINDVNVSPRTQIKQVLALGLSYTLL